MQVALARAALIVISVGIGSNAGAQAMDSTHHDSTAQSPAANAVPVADMAASPSFPVELRGYHLTDSVSLGDASSGKQYTYTRNKNDQINVFVSPYQSEDKLYSQDDTVNFVLNDVDRFYQTIDLAARQGTVIHSFRLLHRGSDDFKTRGRTVRGASVWFTFERRTTAVRLYSYYAAFAMPGQAVRIRAEAPAISVGNEDIPTFARQLIGAMAPQ